MNDIPDITQIRNLGIVSEELSNQGLPFESETNGQEKKNSQKKKDISGQAAMASCKSGKGACGEAQKVIRKTQKKSTEKVHSTPTKPTKKTAGERKKRDAGKSDAKMKQVRGGRIRRKAPALPGGKERMKSTTAVKRKKDSHANQNFDVTTAYYALCSLIDAFKQRLTV